MTSNIDNTSRNGKIPFPYDILDVDDAMLETICEDVKEIIDASSVLVGPKKYFLPGMYKNCYSEIYNFKARQDDILLIGFPRSGTTLHSEMVWQIENDLDLETVKKVILIHRFPIIDLCLSMGDMTKLNAITGDIKIEDDVKDIVKRYGTMTVDHLANFKERRFIRSHLPISLLSPSFFNVGCKVIYCARDPRDLVVSYYHISQFFRPKEWGLVPFPSFWKIFKNDWVIYCPLFEHMKEAWDRRHEDNFLFLFYEDTVKDLKQGITKVAKFLGKELTSTQLERLADYLGVEKFKKNKSVNCQHLCDLGIASKSNEFIRNGTSGGWRKYFLGDLKEEAEEWVRGNLKDSELMFPGD